MVPQVSLEDRGKHIHLLAVDVKLSNKINLETEFALALAPLLDAVVGDSAHDAACAWLNDDKLICLHSHPRNKLIIILHEDLSLKEMSIVSLALRKNVQDLFARFYLVEMSNSVILA